MLDATSPLAHNGLIIRRYPRKQGYPCRAARLWNLQCKGLCCGFHHGCQGIGPPSAYPCPGTPMPKLRSLAPLVRTTNTATVTLLPKVKAEVYTTPAYRAWRATVVGRAQGRCEAVDHGHRCSRAQPEHRMYADHIVEIKDGGSVLDVNNGQCLCRSHHEIKTVAARSRRLKMEFKKET